MVARTVNVEIVGDAAALAAALSAAPYPGKLKLGDHGPAVHCVQQALEDFGAKRHKTHPHEEHLRLYAPTGTFRRPTALQCGHAQEVYGLPVTNSYGPGLHAKIASHFNEASRKTLQHLDHQEKMVAFRKELLSIQHHTAGYVLDRTQRPGWAYHMDGMRFSILRNGLDIDSVKYATEDCSSYSASLIVIARRRVGLPDPQFFLDHGYGCYTGNMINYGRPIATKDAMVGDRVHYGEKNSHLGTVMGRVQGILSVSSFGGEPGPLPRRLTYRGIYGIRRDDE